MVTENAAPKIFSQPHCFDHVTALCLSLISASSNVSQWASFCSLPLSRRQHQELNNSPNPSVLDFYISKQPHPSDDSHWEDVAVNSPTVSCFSDLFLKPFCPYAPGRNQQDSTWAETSAGLTDGHCLCLYSCRGFLLLPFTLFLRLMPQSRPWWQSQAKVFLLLPRFKQTWV